tara:strand:- start:276 stop:593 length:318 start_codon:yes stop_codon:yes gene_type:complete
MTAPNPFDNSTTNNLKGVIDAVSQVINGGEPTVPEEMGTHADAAASEIAKIEGPHLQGDITKIMQKHFSAGSKGNPQETSVQKAFEKEVGKRVAQQRSAGKWEEH